MKALLEKIRQLLRNRRFRQIWYRGVSGFAAIVVFVTTYALILPAITIEKTADCGIEEHQHDDSCYEKRLICGQEESEGHHHDDSCYTVTKELVCELEEHQHSKENGCYDEEGNLICQLPEHVHGDACYEEVKTLTCGLEEPEGHHHTDACYEKVLVCGKEAHTHSEECYKSDDTANGTSDAAQADSGNAADGTSDAAQTDSGNASNAASGDAAGGADSTTSSEAAAESASEALTDTAAAEEQTDTYVPELDPLNMEAMFSDRTGFYYFHADEDEEIPADSTEITEWKQVNEDTELISTDLVKMYLAYTIPAGSLNETNPTARYRLPENIHLTDDQIKAINKNKNGIYTQYADAGEDADQYLGAEAVEGERRPDEELADGEEEYISAVIRVEKTDDGGQELIFTFVPYTIEKNRNTYDADGKTLKAGEKITGWFACDFNLGQIDWKEDTKADSTKDADSAGTEEAEAADADEKAEKETSDSVNEAKDNTAIEKTSKVTFVEEDQEEEIKEISQTLKLIELNEDAAQEEKEENEQEYQSGTLTAEGDGYSITMDYTAEAQIPQNAELSVREITAETDKEAYEECLAQAKQHVEKSGEDKSNVDKEATRFFDIEILVDDGNGNQNKIEPAAPVKVNIQILDASASKSEETQQSDPTVLHFGDDGVEKVDSTASEASSEDGTNADKGKKKDSDPASGGSDVTEVQFEAESFSVYGIVYTVDFQWEVNGKAYGYSMQGADSVSLKALIETLHVYEVYETDAEAESAGSDSGNSSSESGDPETQVTNDQVNESKASGDAGLDQFMADIEEVSFSDDSLLVPVKVEEDTTVGQIKTDLKLFPTYPLGLSQSEVLALNAKEYKAGDWVLISMKAFDTTEALTIRLKTGECFTILVTDDQDAVMNGDEVQTIANPAGTTIDLFDYWIVDQSYVGRDGWGDLNQSWGGHEDADGLNGSGNNKGINSRTDDTEHGHALKFSPAWEGTVFNGTKAGDSGQAWTSLNKNGRNGLNSYTGGVNPFQGIVQTNLSRGYPILTSNDEIGSNGESLAYLFDPAIEHEGKASYSDVNQLLYVDKKGYYTYDSRDYAAAFDTESKTFTVTEQTSDNSEIRGFWPFGTQNFWSGMHVNTQFSMPANGEVLNPSGNYMPMQFEFSGDDDVWIYVDGILIGDAGGIHNRTEIDINFQTGQVSITGKDTVYLDDLFRTALADQGKSEDEIAQYISDNFDGHTFKTGSDHSFDFFYLERGGGESNLYIHYNLISTSDFTAHKSYTSYNLDGTQNTDDVLKRDQFQFELVGYDDEEGNQAIMPAGSSDGEGTVASPKLTYNASEGYTSLLTGVSEDGNVNFGNVTLTQADLGKKFRYMVREVIPEDAELVDGKYVKDGITYDQKVYYFTGEVQETLTGFKLKKTRYTDPECTLPDTETKFNSFDNSFTPEAGSFSFNKTDNFGNPVEGAGFTLYMDSACKTAALDGDGEVLTASSLADGTVTMDNIPAPKTYYMKETTSPDGYLSNDTVYEVYVAAANDQDDSSVITVYGDESGTVLTDIINSKPGEISARKVWQNASGKVISETQDIEVTLKRKKTSVPDDVTEKTITLKLHIDDNTGWGQDYTNMNVEVSETIAADEAEVIWYDSNQDYYELTVTDASGNALDESKWSVGQLPADGSYKRLELKDLTGDVTIQVNYASGLAWLWQSGHIERFSNPSINYEEPVEIVNDDDFALTAVLTSPGYSKTWKSGGTTDDYASAGYDVPAADSNNRPYYYYVEEQEIDGYTTSYTNNDGIQEGIITITNRKASSGTIDVNILKTDDTENSTNYLADAVFALQYRADESGSWTAVSSSDVPELDEDGRFTVPASSTGITLTGLVDGCYRLQEITAPEGYVITEEYPVVFTVSGGLITGTDGTMTSVTYTAAADSSPAQFIVPNTPGAALPNTGGPGTRLFTILGSILILGAGVLLWRRRRLI